MDCNHGGKRSGSGRPRSSYETKQMRVPVDLEPLFKNFIDYYKLNQKVPDVKPIGIIKAQP